MGKAANATPKERQGMDAGIFCGPSRTFPIEDQGDVDSAAKLIGKAKNAAAVKACIIGKAKAHGWTLPDAWQSGATFSEPSVPVVFTGERVSVAAFTSDGLTKYGTVTLADGGDYVIRRGKVFAVGDYPDKQFKASPEELVVAALDFSPVPNRVQHLDPDKTPTFFDGHLGELRSLNLADDGETLIGEVAIPTWFDTFMREKHPDHPFSVSLEFHPTSKRVIGNTIVPNPRIHDSDLIAGFAEFAGQKGIQAMHDMALAHGASCTAANANMAMTHEDVMQRFHDVAKAHGAVCLPSAVDPDGDGIPDAQDPRDRARMARDADKITLGQLLKFFATGKDPRTDGGTKDGSVVTQPPQRAEEEHDMADTVTLAQFAAMEARVKAAEERLAAERADRRRAEAVAFADRMIDQHRIFPVAREGLIRQYILSAEDDDATPKTVTFAGTDGKDVTGNRLEALEALFSVMPQHMLTQEQLKDSNLIELANRIETQQKRGATKPDQKRVDELMGHTQTGKMILAEREASAK